MTTKTADQSTSKPPVVPKKYPIDVQKLLYIVGCIFFFALAIAALTQLYLLQSFGSTEKQLAVEAEQLSVAIAQDIQTVQTKVRALAAEPIIDPLFPAAESPVDSAMMPSRDGVVEQLAAKLPEASSVQLIDAAAQQKLIGGDYQAFGFARTEMLREAIRLEAAPAVQMIVKGADKTLVLVEPIRRDERTVAYLLVEAQTNNFQAAVAKTRALGGVVDLRLRSRFLDSVPVYRRVGGPVQDDELKFLPVANSTLSVGYGASKILPFPLGDSPLTLLILGIAGLVGGFAVIARDRLGGAVAKVRSKFVKTGQVEPTMAEQLRAEAAAEKARPAPAPAKAVTAAVAAITTKDAVEFVEPAKPVPKLAIDRSIFRAYDIRGVLGQSLDTGVAELIGLAVGSEIRQVGRTDVVVGRDGRLSGPDLSQALIRGLRRSGCDVIDVGAVPTPVLYYACHQTGAGSGVMVTGSHNPPDYNGFKIVINGETLAAEWIQKLYARIAEDRFSQGNGSLRSLDLAEEYIDRISGDVQLESPLRIIIDAGNGIAGEIAPRLFEAIGCDVTPLYCEVDGTFPNHHPDPSEPKNLSDLIMLVKQTRADLGIAFDGDGDRLGVVTAEGNIIYPDKLLMLFAQDVLSRNPGSSVIYDVKCTGALGGIIRAAGGVPIMWKTGHSLIKGKIKETDAQLAGEMSGHFFFKERWYGFDDGLYAGCRLLEIIASSGLSLTELLADLPHSVSTPELKITMREGEHFRFMQRFSAKAKFEGARITTIDGIRADWEDGWGLVRPSNTTPVLVLRFEARNDDGMARIQQAFRDQILSIDPKLSLPF